MKKILFIGLFVLITAATVFAQISRGGTAWVSVRTATLKSSTGIFASNRGEVSYGDQVTVLQVSGNWTEVRSSDNANLTGWISTASLSAKRIVATGGTSTATASEVALAGKGFNQDVENEYKASGNLNFAAVDWMESIIISDDDLQGFIADGRLSAGGN